MLASVYPGRCSFGYTSMPSHLKPLLLASLLSLVPSSVTATEQVGEAVLIKTSVSGDGRRLVTRSPVHRDERIVTSSTGLGEFIFRDGTKFAVGMNSSVVIDSFVFAGDGSFKDLTLKAAKGSFRWISGGSPSSAYKIDTPAGIIGVRGTALDVYVGDGGLTAVVLLSGAARFCGPSSCQDLRRRCDYVIATPQGAITSPVRVTQGVLRQVSNAWALPFLTGDQSLTQGFQTGSSCGFASATAPSSSEGRDGAGSPSPTPSPDIGDGEDEGNDPNY